MIVGLNAVLYVFALTLALSVISPLPEGAGSRMRAARAALTWGGGMVVTVAITLAFVGRWFESAIAGTAAIFVVAICLWFALTRVPSRRDDDEDDDDDDGGGRRDPVPPAPTEPAGGPSGDLWDDFDAAREAWERDGERRPLGV
ncbi:MAG TPA: hypothetical protein VM299_00080 [Solirubrobacteraceae bacterium]|jgi:hypothetical protein|nr:hypothetical protein [Solirubrobacteraceae bacterium]